MGPSLYTNNSKDGSQHWSKYALWYGQISWNFMTHPWTRLGYGKISIETATHSLQAMQDLDLDESVNTADAQGGNLPESVMFVSIISERELQAHEKMQMGL